MSNISNQTTHDNVASKEKLAIGITLIVWSINCAIMVSNNFGASFLHSFVQLLLVGVMFLFPPLGAYFIVASFDSN